MGNTFLFIHVYYDTLFARLPAVFQLPQILCKIEDINEMNHSCVWCEWMYMLNLCFYRVSSYHWIFLSSPRIKLQQRMNVACNSHMPYGVWS